MNLEGFEGALVKSGTCNEKGIAAKVVYHRHQMAHLCKSGRRGQAHQRNHQLKRWRWSLEDYSSLWTARERAVLHHMEKNLETSESIQVEVSELDHFQLGPEDADTSIRSLAENARDGAGYSKFVLLNILRGTWRRRRRTGSG